MSTPNESNNYYSCLNNEEEDDDKTIVTSNCKADRTRTTDELSTDSTISSYEIEERQNRSEARTNSQGMISNWHRRDNPHTETIYNASNIKISEDMAIADAGATSHFLIKRAPVLNKQITMKPLRINLPDGAQLYSTHTATLDIPWIPPNARKAHIVPGLSHTSLISVKSLCDEGCIVTYNKSNCNIEYEGRLVWQGVREPSTGLWILPLNPNNPPDQSSTTKPINNPPTKETAFNVHAISSKASVVKFLHQCLLSPPKATLLKAVENNQLPTWPGLTPNAIKKYLPDTSPATDKGHMKRQRKGLRSTKEKVSQALDKIEYERDMNPPVEREEQNQLFCYSGHMDPKTGTIYTDFTGKFPLRSIDGMATIFILYDWTTNAILATPVTDVKDATIVESFKKNIEYLTNRGFRPCFNIIDNVASKSVQTYLEGNGIKMQLVEPHNHRVNAAERAIQTFKNHLISGFCTIDKHCPAAIWSKFIPQAQDSLNMLRTSRVHPKVSAYHVLEGVHDFNRVPWCPIGTRATVFNPPETRTSWGTRALDAFYVLLAPKHYRCWQFFVPSAGGTRIAR